MFVSNMPIRMVGGAPHKLVAAEAEHFKRSGINIEKGAICTLKERALQHVVEHLLILAEKLSHKRALVRISRFLSQFNFLTGFIW